MLWFSMLEPGSSYWSHLMPAMFATAVGVGLSFVPMTLGAVSHVRDEDTGIASALLNTSQQVGGAVGLAVLTTSDTAASDRRLPDADTAFFRGLATRDPDLVQRAAIALTHGYTTAFSVAAAFFTTGLLIAAITITAHNGSVKVAVARAV
ncbi:MFS transporter [Mycolicibacterium palauense]|uniref:hypothetical protein n=1 Tax=Mycolicibacterium palauense TaxID=2034511 RepID=UPI00159BE19D|nr:hypothetical protein [Mycolicibacterium palauense]